MNSSILQWEANLAESQSQTAFMQARSRQQHSRSIQRLINTETKSKSIRKNEYSVFDNVYNAVVPEKLTKIALQIVNKKGNGNGTKP